MINAISISLARKRSTRSSIGFFQFLLASTPECVDPEFFTGAVNITLAHDHNDFELGKHRGLALINILHDDGTLNSNAGDFAGQRRFDA